MCIRDRCDNVHLLTTSTSDLPTALSDVRPEDCLLVISYARYTSSSYDTVSYTHLEMRWEEKADQIRIYSGAKYRAVEEAEAGTVCAVTGLSLSLIHI